MLKFANIIHQIIFRLDEFAKSAKNENFLFQYRINERANSEIEVIIYCPNQKVDLDFSDVYENLTIEYISEKEYNNEDGFYKSFFDNENVLQGYTYRLENIFDTYKPIKKSGLPPIVSFYSYKGGVGRTTTLACFAAYLSRKEGKKVVMIDCDFEAPGFFNFFELNAETASKNGLVEYLLDSQIKEVDLKDYVIEISKEYSGNNGELYAMLAGNLSNEPVDRNNRVGYNLDTHLEHYLHGLARLDLANPYEVERQFESLFKAIKEQYNPDVILIDSRTGFSEVFSNLVIRFSNLVVGFFGNNDQNKAGLEFFTQIFKKDSIKYVLVNSLLFKRDLLQNFSKKIGEFIEQSIGNKNSSIYQPHIFEILNGNQTLQEQGANQTEQKPYFVNLIDDYDRQFPAYYASHENINPNKHLFKFLFEEIMDTVPKEILEIDATESLSISTSTSAAIQPRTINLLEKKRAILTQLGEQYFIKYQPEYADSFPLDADFLEKFFYFRTQMFDILNENKFIIRGYKGTGKTLFYEALTDSRFNLFRETFLRKAKSHIKNFVFVDMVSLKRDLKPILGYFKDDYKRFWTIYSWNTLMVKKQRHENNLHEIISFEPKLTTFELSSNNTENWKFLGEYVKDEHFFVIEKELVQLDKDLKITQTKLLLLFDYLDILILPNEWSDKYNPISQLIEHWRFRPYTNIESKLFVRTDLYNRLGGINNFNSLEAMVIDFEWKREELFVYFFQILLKVAKQDFYEYAQKVLDSNFEGKAKFYIPLEKIKQVLNENEDQIKSSLKESSEILKTFVSVFFGEYTDLRREVEKKHLSYNWFFNNLSNANQTFSLRVFIVLIRKALKGAKLDLERNDRRSEFPIVSGYFFTNPDTRKEAANAHLNDLISEEKRLGYFKEFFDEHKQNQEYKNKFFKTLLYQSEMKQLLEIIIQENTLNISWRDFLKILEDSGIIRETKTTNALAYSFAFLYKYAFGLKSSWN